MESIREWVTALCACSAAVSLAQTLLPDTAVKKAVNIVLSLIIASCLIEPISMIRDIHIDIDPIDAAPYTDWLDTITLGEFEDDLRTLTEGVLCDIGVTAREIDIRANISSDGSVYIEKMRITIDRQFAERIDEIENTVFERLGIDADVRVIDPPIKS